MWQSLQSHQNVQPGDKVRYLGSNNGFIKEKLFKVVRSEQHYFEIIPADLQENNQDDFKKNIIRYFDLGYNMRFEKWLD